MGVFFVTSQQPHSGSTSASWHAKMHPGSRRPPAAASGGCRLTLLLRFPPFCGHGFRLVSRGRPCRCISWSRIALSFFCGRGGSTSARLAGGSRGHRRCRGHLGPERLLLQAGLGSLGGLLIGFRSGLEDGLGRAVNSLQRRCLLQPLHRHDMRPAGAGARGRPLCSSWRRGLAAGLGLGDGR